MLREQQGSHFQNNRKAGIRFKDYSGVVESLAFSEDSKTLLVSYKIKTCPKYDEGNGNNLELLKPGNKICEWDVVHGEILNFYHSDNKISCVQYLQCPNSQQKILFGGTLPCILTNWVQLDCLINLKEVNILVLNIKRIDLRRRYK